MSKDDFVATLKSIYEHSPWVAEETFDMIKKKNATIDSVTSLHATMKSVVEESSQDTKLKLINSHPDLAGKAAVAGSLTKESTEEQKRAGLSSLTQAEMEKFTMLNSKYKEKFGFVFILAVRNATKRTILGAFEARLENSREREFNECIAQIHKIAWMRLLTQFNPAPTGFLTCHVLDTALGKPANGLRISLFKLDIDSDSKHLLGEFVTNSDGRLNGPALKGESFKVGVYEWVFHVSDYFAKECLQVAGTPFLTEVPLRFGIDNPEDHYHVPLLVSPYSYSTYRGS
eukprot:CAMPEP_0184011626 /NCGR_PEP_ID=MMETSP0954-20121128/3931_1 /TAXON_ID=627963 /ORGANISM="Aplanochytrium sp, Strain PBS07" /LENGTH=286 /DNA_ID=CAMNT_0026291463 /DNA_START=117 /DNA_END=977 /DNA_ORIENTATION=+